MPDRVGLFPALLGILGRTQNRVVADLYGKSFQHAATRKTADVISHQADDDSESIGASRVGFSDSWQTFGEHLTSTAWVPATEPSDAHSQLHHQALPRQVLHCT